MFSKTILVLTAAIKQTGSAIQEVLELGKSGGCSCLKQDEDSSIVIPTKYSIEDILSEESAVQVFVLNLFLNSKKVIRITISKV